jgi:anti-sigma factor RsiW
VHVRLDDLELYVRGGLGDAETTEISSHLAACPECSEKLSEARGFLDQLARLSERQMTHPSPPERRKSPRVPADDPARIKLLYPAVSEPLPARILDVSKDGMKLELSQVLEPGATIEVLFKRFVAIAEVRYSIRVGDVYRCGVLIQDVFSKS